MNTRKRLVVIRTLLVLIVALIIFLFFYFNSGNENTICFKRNIDRELNIKRKIDIKNFKKDKEYLYYNIYYTYYINNDEDIIKIKKKFIRDNTRIKVNNKDVLVVESIKFKTKESIKDEIYSEKMDGWICK